MRNPDWYPFKLSVLVPWYSNFSAQAAAAGTTYGLTAAQVAQIALDASNVATLIAFGSAVEAFRQAASAWKKAMLTGGPTQTLPPPPAAPSVPSLSLSSLPGIEARTRQYAAIIRASPLYTPQVGERFGIVAAASGGYDTPTLSPKSLTQSRVEVSLFKAGYQVLAIDSRRGGGAWEMIGVSMTAKYVDDRPPLVNGAPEVREYRAQGMLRNARVGAISPVVSAVTVP